MTTKVEVKNTGDSLHSVNVFRMHGENQEFVKQLAPKESVETYIWEGVKLVAIEVKS